MVASTAGDRDLLARPGVRAPGVRRAVRVGLRRALGRVALPARGRADAGVPPLLRAPRLPDEPRRPLRLDVHRRGGHAEGAALVGRPPRLPPQVRRPRRRSAQPEGERVLLRAHRMVPERSASTRRSTRPIPVVRDFSKYPEMRLLDEYYFLPPLLLGAGDVRDRRVAVGGLGLLPADDDAGARHVRDQHGQPPVRIAPLRNARRIPQQRRSPRCSRPARAGTTTTTATSAPRATGSTGGSSTSPTT